MKCSLVYLLNQNQRMSPVSKGNKLPQTYTPPCQTIVTDRELECTLVQPDWNKAEKKPDTDQHPSLSDNRHRQVVVAILQKSDQFS